MTDRLLGPDCEGIQICDSCAVSSHTLNRRAAVDFAHMMKWLVGVA